RAEEARELESLMSIAPVVSDGSVRPARAALGIEGNYATPPRTRQKRIRFRQAEALLGIDHLRKSAAYFVQGRARIFVVAKMRQASELRPRLRPLLDQPSECARLAAQLLQRNVGADEIPQT